jgi:hypothetical protein
MYLEVSKNKMGTLTDKDYRAINEEETGGPSQLSQKESSPMADPTPMEVPSSKPTGLRGRKLVFSSPIAIDKVNPERLFTRATTKQNVPVKDDAAKTSS